jgi:hypothetical protein
MLFAQSPPNMQGPVAFVAPGLNEETIMDVRYQFSSTVTNTAILYHNTLVRT